MAQYRLGMRYRKILTYNINKALTRGPALPIFTTAISSIKSYETKTYTLTSSSCEIESVVGTNITCSYDQSTKTLTLSDPIGPVSLTFVTYYNENNLCWLYVGGHGGGETLQTFIASWPNKGTISYIDKYNEPKTINVADLGLYIRWKDSSHAFWRIHDVKLGCDVVCSNIGLAYVNKDNSYLRFSNTESLYDKQVLIIGNGTTSYTFTNVIKVPEQTNADVRINGTR